jgi:hypothetical protein
MGKHFTDSTQLEILVAHGQEWTKLKEFYPQVHIKEMWRLAPMWLLWAELGWWGEFKHEDLADCVTADIMIAQYSAWIMSRGANA